MSQVVGQTCPFCQFPIKPDEAHVSCPQCRTPHHEDCWRENGSKCTTFGCQGMTAGAAAVCSRCGQVSPAGSMFCNSCGTQLMMGSPVQGYPPPPPGYPPSGYPAQVPPTVPGQPGYAAQPGYSVQADYPKASSGSRFCASFIDGIIGLLFMLPGFIFISGKATQAFGGFLFVAGIIACLIYTFIKDGLNGGGQSYGKKACDLIVIHLPTNQPCSTGRSALRSLAFYIPYVGNLIECIMVLATDRGRRLGDLMASTQVVNLRDYRR